MEIILTIQQKILLCVIVGLCILNVIAWQYVFVLAGPHYLKVDALDVGQGDSLFVETPSMRHILIDGGPDQSVLGQLAKQLPFWEKSLDVVILTHPDSDHVNGLLDVLKNYKVDYIVWTGIVRGGEQYQQWLKLLAVAKTKGTHIVITKLGDQIINGNVKMDILHPFENIAGQDFRPTNDDNDTGIVSRLTYGKNSFLFTADISSDVEQQLLDRKMNLASDVLKVAHHGSRFSSSADFVKAVHSSIAVISVGAHNTYGHPTPEVLQRLKEFGITTLTTAKMGVIELLSDGNTITIKKK